MANTSSRERPFNSLTSVMPVDGSVSVPVLSSTTVSMRASRSMASARVTSTPRRASLAVAAASATGVASDSAQGQVTTSTASTAGKARAGSTNHQHTAVATASTRITPTNQLAARSARRTSRGRSVRARSCSATMEASVELLTECTVTSVSGSPTFTLPPRISSPAWRRMAADSPVSSDSSSIAEPEPEPTARFASTGITPPLGTVKRSPGTSAAAVVCSRSPSSRSRQTIAGRLRARASAEVAPRCRTLISMKRPAVRKNTNMPTESKYTSPEPRKVFTTLGAQAINSASATGTSMPTRRCVMSRQAPNRMGAPL